MARFTRRPLYLRGGVSGRAASYWPGSQSDEGIPEDAIRTEAGIEIRTESGLYLLTEN